MLNMTTQKSNIIITILLVLLLVLGMYTIYISNSTDKKIEEIEYANKQKGEYTELYYSNTINALKKENKALYDSIKSQKDEIDFLIQFKYQKEYVIDTVFINNNDTIDKNLIKNEYKYTSNKNDTLNYELSICAEKEPYWYFLKLHVNDEFTIVNKNYGDLNRIDINTSNNTEISDVIVINKKEKYNPFKQISIGPSITGGYDIINSRFGLMVGVSITYDLIPK